MGKNMETLWKNRMLASLPINNAGRDVRQSRRERSDEAKRQARHDRMMLKYGY